MHQEHAERRPLSSIPLEPNFEKERKKVGKQDHRFQPYKGDYVPHRLRNGKEFRKQKTAASENDDPQMRSPRGLEDSCTTEKEHPSTSRADQETEKRRHAYPEELTQHLKELSEEKHDTLAIYKEWRLHDIEDREMCDGHCHCGKQEIRYYYYIMNTKTGHTTHVGSRCIELFEGRLKTVAEVARKLLVEGAEGRLIAIENNGSNVRLGFEIHRDSGIVKHKDKLKYYYASLPLKMPRAAKAQNPVLLTKAKTGDINLSKLRKGSKYRIRVRLWNEIDENDDNHLRAELIQCDLKERPISSRSNPFILQ